MWVLPRWKERTDSHKLSSDLVRHTDTQTKRHRYPHGYTHMYNIIKMCVYIYTCLLGFILFFEKSLRKPRGQLISPS